MDKSPDAFRTISEVADWLGVPTHVLRFWESRFNQIKPVKRAGGRRYYRPADMALLGGIKQLLHEDGLTIRGVQKVLREQGVKHVAGLSPPLDGEAPDADAAEAAAPTTGAGEGGTPDAAPPAEAAEAAETPDPDAALLRFPFLDDPAESKPRADAPQDQAAPTRPAPAQPQDGGAAPAAFAADVPDHDPADEDPSIPIRGAAPLVTAPGMTARLVRRREELAAIRDRLAALQARRRGEAPRPGGS
jgi:DNA-binding transcriptional MerR regulator